MVQHQTPRQTVQRYLSRMLAHRTRPKEIAQMKNKERLEICRKHRKRLFNKSVEQQKEITRLRRRIREIEAENFKLFCDLQWKQSIDSALDELRSLNVEPPLEPLPMLPWWKVLLP
jgi:hypothetical protein